MFLRKDYRYQNKTYESGFIFDFWSCSSAENDSKGKKFAGAYPAGFLKRWSLAFQKSIPDKAKILHVCAGRIEPTENIWTLDRSNKYKPTFHMKAELFHENPMMKPYLNYFDWVMSDSPYNEEASKKYYNVPLLNKRKMLKAMIEVTKVGGMIGVLDQTMPIQVGFKNIKKRALIAVTSIPNLDARIFTVFQKLSK